MKTVFSRTLWRWTRGAENLFTLDATELATFKLICAEAEK